MSEAASEQSDPSYEQPGGLLGLVVRLRALDGWLQRAEVGVCLAALLTMIGLASAQVALRKLQGDVFQPVPWFDKLSRHLVIWVGMFGASLAAAEGRHIAIEALPKLLGLRGRRILAAVVQLAALAGVLPLLALSVIYLRYSQEVGLLADEPLFEIETLGGLAVYRWLLLAPVPLGLALICWRFGLGAAEAAISPDARFEAQEREREREDLTAGHGDEIPLPPLAVIAAPPQPKGTGARRRLRPDTPPPTKPRIGQATDEVPAFGAVLTDQSDVVEPEATASDQGRLPTESTELFSSDSATDIPRPETSGQPDPSDSGRMPLLVTPAEDDAFLSAKAARPDLTEELADGIHPASDLVLRHSDSEEDVAVEDSTRTAASAGEPQAGPPTERVPHLAEQQERAQAERTEGEPPPPDLTARLPAPELPDPPSGSESGEEPPA